MSTNHASDNNALFALLADGLYTASQTAWEAHHAAARGKDNEAIGTLMSVLSEIETYAALCRTIIAFHRTLKDGAA